MMNDEIKVGLDFGTHQTKICVKIVPDEGHGEPKFEFFKFKDLDGKDQFFLPSVVQINMDDTVSYGYIDNAKEKQVCSKPVLNIPQKSDADFNVINTAANLYIKYATRDSKVDDVAVLVDMLNMRKNKLQEQQNQMELRAIKQYENQMENYKKSRELYRYFKQATFAEREWNKRIDCKKISIWYLAYIIFLLDEKYGNNYGINMGIPVDDQTYEAKKELAVEVLLSAFHLVEDVFEHNFQSFLSAKVDELLEKTEFISYSYQAKYDYNINIFPEAYASLVGLTSKGKLSTGMSLTVDIGGGTTDISFFNIQEEQPVIYRYWSIPRGLNYIAEKSGFDYADEDFTDKVDQEIVKKYNRKKHEIVVDLIMSLVKQFTKDTNLPSKDFYHALNDRIVVYNGGGSMYNFLTSPISHFTDVKCINSSIWKEENLKYKIKVNRLCQLLSIAYGLSIPTEDSEVQLGKFTSFFSHIEKYSPNVQRMIDKDCC